MLRATVIVLLAANLAYFAWTSGSLAGLGLAPAQQNEPERLQAQVQPELLSLLNGAGTGAGTGAATPPLDIAAANAGAPAVAPVAATVSPTCWQAAGFAPPQARKLGAALSDLGLAESQWRFTEVRSSGRWVVFMGRYNPDQMERKKNELRELKIEFREVNLPATGPGLALGTFPSEEAVQQALKDVAKKGVRTARAAVERPETVTMTLRLPAITDEQRAMVEGLGEPLTGKKLQSCE